MSQAIEMSPSTTRNLRIAGWSLFAVLLILPAVAMQFSDDVAWTAGDFVFAAIMLALVGGLCELAAWASTNLAYRVGVGVAVLTGLLTIWITMAVGIVGEPENPLNLVYFAMIAIAASTAITAWGNPRSLARAMWATAGVQFLIGLAHLIDSVQPAVMIDAFFTVTWFIAGALFARAAKDREVAAPSPQP